MDPRWDGGEDRSGRRHRAVWYDVARLVLADRLTPDELIDAAFAVHDEGSLPLPATLLTPAVIHRAMDYRGEQVVGFAKTWPCRRGFGRRQP